MPLDVLQRHRLEASDIEARVFDERYVGAMRELIARTRELFAEGWPLTSRVDARLSVDIELFSRGGMAVLDAIEAMGYNTLAKRPAIGAPKRMALLGRTLVHRIVPITAAASANATRPSTDSRIPANPANGARAALDRSYEDCRSVARNAASNFYYAFYMLPRPKRDALCAIYAFMRLVDDVSDSPLPSGDDANQASLKRAGLSRWNTEGHSILPAFGDTLGRYRIPSRYFHDLISGAEMDLFETSYPTFESLQEYCYRVAGTVGLTCIHVFGFQDPHALELAERLGIAFQLTNILRDVGPDLALGRVYLPAEDLTRFECSVADLKHGRVTPQTRELLRFEAERAWGFYREGVRLISKIDADSRATLWSLVRIYSTLLVRMEERDFDVFSSRVRLTRAEKVRILARAGVGLWSEADVFEERDRNRRRFGGTLLRRRAS